VLGNRAEWAAAACSVTGITVVFDNEIVYFLKNKLINFLYF